MSDFPELAKIYSDLRVVSLFNHLEQLDGACRLPVRSAHLLNRKLRAFEGHLHVLDLVLARGSLELLN